MLEFPIISPSHLRAPLQGSLPVTGSVRGGAGVERGKDEICDQSVTEISGAIAIDAEWIKISSSKQKMTLNRLNPNICCWENLFLLHVSDPLHCHKL